MKALKIFIVILVIFLSIISGAWYYITSKVASKINEEYAGKQFTVQGIDKRDYIVMFEEVVPSGFPFKLAWKVKGWKEESQNAEILYSSPIKFGYNLLSQQIFVRYDGEIKAAYKPVKHNFGSKIKVDDYNIAVDFPLNISLFGTLRNMKDPVELVNHIGDINITSDSVEIFDLVNDEKFYHKDSERLKLSFVPQKQYTNLEDLLNNIPQHYTVSYKAKTTAMDVPSRNVPASLFYGFSLLPSGFDLSASAVIKTEGNKIEEIKDKLEVNAEISCDLPVINLRNLKLFYKSGDNKYGRNHVLDAKSQMHVKTGMFDKLFESYQYRSSRIASSSIGKLIDREMQYIINNKDAFRFSVLENNDYTLNMKMDSSGDKKKSYIKIDDLSIFSKDAGIRLQHEMEIDGKWIAKGVLLVKNYPFIIDLTSGYIYRFGKFRLLSEEARRLYAKTNAEFLKSISDHPESESNDLSFEYDIDSRNLDKAKFGNARINQLPRLHTLTLYENLLDKVGPGGNVLERMQKIIPDIDGNDPLLKKVLPRISDVEKSIKKTVDKVPSDAKDAINKIIPKKVKEGENLLKNLIK